MKNLIAIVLAGAWCTSVSAQVVQYVAAKGSYHEQTTDDVAPGIEGYTHAFGASLFCTSIEDAATAHMTFDGPLSPFVLDPLPPYPYFGSSGGYFDTREDLDTAFPPALYTFSIAGGTLGEQFDTLDMNVDLWPTTVAYFTGDTFSRLTGMRTNRAFHGTFASFTPPEGVNVAEIGLFISSESGEAPSFEGTYDPSDGSFTIPAGTLAGGTQYIVGLSFSTQLYSPSRFPSGTATGIAAFSRLTTFVFVTGCPADFDGDGFVSGVDFDLFVQAFEAGDAEADFNGDGFVSGVDFDEYVVSFETSCPA